MKENEQVIQEQEEMERHSLVCNDELFNKDLLAIVDDTMQEDK
ncbi:hypothetical protein SOP94_10260 [Peribacillus frigoritolerans]|nr:hypothetical protein [Peribacillus frigoritolerans]MEB2628829.1 hypothetical protein [Peribacillus frigoritolerans]